MQSAIRLKRNLSTAKRIKAAKRTKQNMDNCEAFVVHLLYIFHWIFFAIGATHAFQWKCQKNSKYCSLMGTLIRSIGKSTLWYWTGRRTNINKSIAMDWIMAQKETIKCQRMSEQNERAVFFLSFKNRFISLCGCRVKSHLYGLIHLTLPHAHQYQT